MPEKHNACNEPQYCNCECVTCDLSRKRNEAIYRCAYQLLSLGIFSTLSDAVNWIGEMQAKYKKEGV